jgi:copper(I)-binding protein
MVTADRPATSNLVVSDGWFRALPASVPSGGYFVLRNGGDRTMTLSAVETPACGTVMIHKSSNGAMEHVMSLDVAAGETVQFAPGGYHLMCMDAKPVLKPGTSVPVTLIFSDGERVTATFRVRNAVGK